MKLTNIVYTAIVLLMGCSSSTEETRVPKTSSASNTEINEWGDNYKLKLCENAHSGSMVALVDSSIEYSYGYTKIISEISKTRVDSLEISYWVFLKNEKAIAKTVLSIENIINGEGLYWKGNLIGDKIKEYNKWMRVQETFAIPRFINAKNKLKIYVWNNSKEEILLDDFKVDFY